MSAELLAQLTAPFAIEEHKVREGATSKASGKVQWLVYIDKEPIINRLNALFGLEWGQSIETRQLDKNVVVVDCHITINGVSRGLNGADSNSFNDHDVAKSAGSDAFKRAATMWGIGLYLYSAPMIWTDGGYNVNGKIDYDKRNAQEKEALGKVQSWLRQLGLASPHSASKPDTSEAKAKLGQNGKKRVPAEKAEAVKPEAAPVEPSATVVWDTETLKGVGSWLTSDSTYSEKLPCVGYLEAALRKEINIQNFPTKKDLVDAYHKYMSANTDPFPGVLAGINYFFDQSETCEPLPFDNEFHRNKWIKKHIGEIDIEPAWTLHTLLTALLMHFDACKAAKPENIKDDAATQDTLMDVPEIEKSNAYLEF